MKLLPSVFSEHQENTENVDQGNFDDELEDDLENGITKLLTHNVGSLLIMGYLFSWLKMNLYLQ